eukprot:546928_1
MAYCASNENKHPKAYTNEDLVVWIKSFLSEKWQDLMVNKITKSGVNGRAFNRFHSGYDIKNTFDIKQPMLYNRVYREWKKLQQEYKSQKEAANVSDEKKNDEFKVQIFGQSKFSLLNQYVTSKTIVKYLKQLYREESGCGCWCTLMSDELTLGDCGIVNERHLITVKFRGVGGGLESVWYYNDSLHVGLSEEIEKGWDGNYESKVSAFSIPIFHVSCQSDKIKGQNMIGVVLYLCDNKTEFYLNEMKCKCGYIMLVNADKLDKINTKQGTMHSKAFKYFTGKELQDMNIVGGGFAIKNGSPKFRSNTFNSATDEFHNGKKEMHILEQQCIESAVNNWKINVQNTKVSDLYKGAICRYHGFRV